MCPITETYGIESGSFKEAERGLRKSERKTSRKMGKRNQRLEFFRRMAKSKTRSRNKKEAKVS